jgi:opacity protein-like surface antigen
MRPRTYLFIALLLLFASTASPAQTSVAASLYGAFNGATNGNGTQESPANQAGALFELRQIKNPLVGYEATYSWNRANQGLASASAICPAGGSCTVSSAAISSDAHEVTADWVVSMKFANLRPFALAGGGILVDVPTGGTVTTISCGEFNPLCAAGTTPAATSTSTKGVFVYGGGLDWGLLPHIGLRLQYRGNLYKAPDLVNAFSSTGAFMHTAEPMIGVYFRL